MRAIVLALAATISVLACSGSATPKPTPAPTGMPPGTYSSSSFQPQVTFTVPSGWLIDADTERYLALRPVISDLVGIYLFGGPLPAAQEPACPGTPQPGVEATPSALSAWIGSLPGLAVSPARLVSVGGLTGTEVDIQIASGWTTSCPYANGLPAVPLFVGHDGSFRWTVAGTERLRLDLLGGPNGTTIAVDIDAFDGALMADLVAAAQPIVRSMVFKVG